MVASMRMAAETVAAILELLRDVPDLRGALARIPDRREAQGELPRRITVDADSAVASALASVFSARAIRRVGGKFQIDLGRAQTGLPPGELDATLHAALDRAPRDRCAEATAVSEDAVRRLGALRRSARSAAANAYLDEQIRLAEANKGEWVRRLREGERLAMAEAAKLLRCVDAAIDNRESVRLATFSARVAGDSKWLVPGGERTRMLGMALFAHDPATRQELLDASIDLAGPDAARLALEARGVLRDEAAVSVLCFGPIMYRKSGRSFDHVASHADLGEPVRLTLQQLRDARIEAPNATRVTVIENLTPFFEHIERLTSGEPEPSEIVIASEGQSTWAVVELVRALGRTGLPIRHATDLDRSGVLIARSLAARARLSMALLGMDARTHRRFAERGQRISPAEHDRLRALLADDPTDALGDDLLTEVMRTGLWIEPERFVEDVLIEA
jgi:hypothetical protein